MYYFKDHLNFSNNLQDNLYILRQRQLKEATYSPSSGGPAVPDSAAGTNELKDRMRNIKQSGDRKQSKEYLEMETEVNRREGPRVDLDPSIKQSSDVKTDKVAGDWVERYAQKLDMDPRKLEAIRRGVIDMATSGRGEDPISQTQDQVAQRGVEAYDRAKQFVVDMQKRDADKKTKSTSPGVATTKPQSIGLDLGDTSPGKPYVVPGSQDWNNMSHEEQQVMKTRAMKNKEIHKFTGGRDAVDPNEQNSERMRFNTDNGIDSFAADINQRSKLANDVIDRSRQDYNRVVIGNWNRSDLADTDMSPNRPFFWPKGLNSIPDTGADSGGYGPPKPSNNIPDTGADAGGYGPPKPKADPVSITPQTSKPSTEYSTDIIDQGKIIMGQESVNDILDRMQKQRNKEISDPYEKEVHDRINKAIGSGWARDRFSLKNYLKSQRDRAESVKRGQENYKAQKVSPKPS